MKYKDLIEQAKAEKNKNNLREAINLYEQAFIEMIDVNDLIDLGLLYLDNQDPNKALSAFTSVVEVFPDNEYGYYGLGLTYEELGKTELAIKAYESAISKRITFSDAYYNIALLYEDNNDDRSYDYYKKTLLYNPNHFWANLNLGSYYERKNWLDLALIHTQKAYQINPDEKMVNYNLGVIYTKQQKFDIAIKHYLKEIENPKGYIMAYLNLGLIYKERYNDNEKAKFYYLQGISKDKDNATLWYNLGCLYAIMKDYENAHNCLLYSLIRDHNIKEYMEKDEELRDFRANAYYKTLLKEIKG